MYVVENFEFPNYLTLLTYKIEHILFLLEFRGFPYLKIVYRPQVRQMLCKTMLTPPKIYCHLPS